MKKNLYEKHWDYSAHSQFYKYRPNYTVNIITMLTHYIQGIHGNKLNIADIGAGTANLTVLLAKNRNFKITAVEPNVNMMAIGKKRTQKLKNVSWVLASGTQTTLQSNGFHWVTYGSSFNVLDRQKALPEASRLLKKNGFMSCMWNHRKVDDGIQAIAEKIIRKHVPDYHPGVRREDQTQIINSSKLFGQVLYVEADFLFTQTKDNYINAWRSVKNKYWDLASESGRNTFDKIAADLEKKLPASFVIEYTTKVWTAQKK